MRVSTMAARRAAAYYRDLGEPKLQVTPTGRAKTPGRVTRNSLSVKRQGGAPLSVDLACHPVALTRTPRNPGCVTGIPWGESYLHHKKAAKARGAAYFTQRAWAVDESHVCTLYVQGLRVHTSSSVAYAMGWKQAASDYGIKVDLFYNGDSQT
jgi:hypothetical protein